MHFGRLSIYVRSISRIGTGNGFRSKFYSASQGDSNRELYRRLNASANPNQSVLPVLDQWDEDVGSLDRGTLRSVVMKMLHFKRYRHALEVSMWMTEKKCYDLTPSDVATRLLLIWNAQGIEQAEQYFNNLPQELIGCDVYVSLLKCYAAVECVEKAEAVVQKMWDLGFAMKSKDYNIILNLYSKTRNIKKLEASLQEMEENGVVRDNFTLAIQLTAYAAVMDVEGMDKVVKMLECDPKVVPDWSNYTIAANGYRKASLPDKAFEMLKKAEACLAIKEDVIAYNELLTQYAKLGKKDEVFRVWSRYKNRKVHNKGYSHFLNSLVKLGEFQKAEKVFAEWESRNDLVYDMNIPNIMIGLYSKKGLVEKAEALIDKAISKGGKPNAWTRYNLVEGYFQNNQPQKAVEMMKKTIVMLSGIEWEPIPEVATLKTCLEYLKGVGDTEQTDEFVELLVDKDVISLDKLEELSIDKGEIMPGLG
ncbi:Tetratricopeptide repeat (TPR)-like superfamily protein [Euphorbia peplus]|nr:Tetratricopeptide repeat (TPR)-like superfamily protein [Euphorbia peplus]